MARPVLVTGAAGGVGRALVPGLRAAGFDPRPTDRVPSGGVVGDLADPGFARAACAGVGAVVHLAADPDPEHGWSDLREPNADVVVNVLDAAAAAGVPRVVLASSIHAIGGHRDAGAAFVADGAPPFPCCVYGATKAFAEALGRTYAQRWDMRVVCLRLGGVRPTPPAVSWLPGWLSPGDLVRLVGAALTADVRFGVYNGISANASATWGIERARAELGYAPVDDSADHAADAVDDTAGPDARALHRT